MKNCCVPFCKSRYDGPVKVRFFEFPSDLETREAWLKVISKAGDKPGSVWKPSDYSVVCEIHFPDADFSKSTKRKRLLPGAIPSIFPGYPSYKLPEFKKKRKPPISRSLETPSVKKICLKENIQETCVPINLSEEVLNEPEELRDEPVQNSSTKCNSVAQKKRAEVISRLHKRMKALRKVNSRLRTTIEKLSNKISALKSERKKESFAEQQLKKIMKGKSENKMSAVMLMEQIKNYGRKKITLNSTALKLYILWQKRSPKEYEFVRNMGIFSLPHKSTLKKYLGYSTGETGIVATSS